METMSEEDKIDWKVEAAGVIRDISANVTCLFFSDRLQANEGQGVYLNLETLEGSKFTIKLNTSGYAIVGRDLFDDNQLEEQGAVPFETVYALLQSISPRYVRSFAGSLQAKLTALARQQEAENNLETQGVHV